MSCLLSLSQWKFKNTWIFSNIFKVLHKKNWKIDSINKNGFIGVKLLAKGEFNDLTI